MEQKSKSIHSILQNQTITTKHVAWIGTIILVAIHLFFLLWTGPNYLNSDDATYSIYAHQIAEGNYKYNHLANPGFQHRYGISVPTALSYKLFGVNRYSLVLWSWISSLLTLILLYNFTLRRFNPSAAFIAGLIFATNTQQIGTALMLSVDVVVSMFMFLTAILLYEARQPYGKGRETFFAIAISITIIFAALSKLAVICIFPAITVLLFVDIKNGQHKGLWLKIIAYGLLCSAFYLLWMHIYTGSYLSRFSGTIDIIRSLDAANQSPTHANMMDNLPARLTYKPILLILSLPGVLITFVLAISSTTIFWGRGENHLKNTGYWWLFIFSILTYIWIGPISLNPYIPVNLVPRYFVPLLPFLSLVAGAALSPIFNSSLPSTLTKQYFWWLCFVFVLIYPLLNAFNFFKLGLLIVTIPVIFALFWERANIFSLNFSYLHKPLKAFLFLATLSILPAHFILNNVIGELPWKKMERESFQRYFFVGKEPKIIYTNERSIVSINFHNGYKQSKNLQLVNWANVTSKGTYEGVKQDTAVAGLHGSLTPKHYIYINKHLIKGLQSTYGHIIPSFVNNPPSDWELVEEREGVAIFTTPNTPNFN
jgi:4-amino-4-deoxy-L-arabinose transferase-like glycosyltransferase